MTDALQDFIQSPKEEGSAFFTKEYKRCPYTNGTHVMEDIYQLYWNAEVNYFLRKEALERTIEKRQEKLKQIIEEHDRTSWIDRVLKPLADIVSAQMAAIHNQEQPWPYKIYGPFGLGCTTTLYIFPEGGDDILDDETYSLTVYPAGGTGKQFYLEYDTGKVTDQYQPGSLGDINGFNHVREKLPDRLGEIIAKFRHHAARKQPEEKKEVTDNE